MSLLEIKNLTTYYHTGKGYNQALEGVSFDVNGGEILGLIGESGCGKTTAGYSMMKMIEYPGQIMEGSVKLNGIDLLTMDGEEHRKVLWKEIAMIPQSAMNALDPSRTVHWQIREAIRLHFPKMSKQDSIKKVYALLNAVGLDEKWANAYPHQLSGGMKQRVVIAMALACDPKVIIADESTSGLDVLIEAQILAILRKLKKERGLGIILISHDLRMVMTVCDRVGIMYAGNLVEIGTAEAIAKYPRHPYTKALFASQIDVKHFDQRVEPIEGVVPRLINPDDRCRFYARCKERTAACEGPTPALVSVGENHAAACHGEV